MTDRVFLPSLPSGGAPLQAMATHSPLSARLAEAAGFDALWASGFELSALYGLADIDAGFGNAVNVVQAVTEYGRADDEVAQREPIGMA